jgi:acetylornithine/succinyldiaminopimelate/putrescine aminotransferase
MGRTGTLFAYEQSGVEPDLMTLAKALASGVPIGALLARDDVAACFGPGSHGSTFGGNALATAAGVATMEALTADGFLAQARALGAHFLARLEDLAARCPAIASVRGQGMMLAITLHEPGVDVVTACLARGLIINCTAERVLRLLPPLVISEAEIDRGIAILEEVLSS